MTDEHVVLARFECEKKICSTNVAKERVSVICTFS